uniref:Phosphoinositide 3-kinase regulatory subunit 5 n=1 Tax=Myripristis murdjan TaxID=586833 RepID=A0A668AZM6_9TELE
RQPGCHTSCTEDRIQHALDRCLDGLRQMLMCSAGQSMNRWSLEELVKRDPENFLILLQQIIRKTRDVQEQCQYELVAPLAIMFASTLLQTPYCPPETELLEEAIEVFRCFLTWPEPYCSVCRNLLSTLQLEIKAPGKHEALILSFGQPLGLPVCLSLCLYVYIIFCRSLSDTHSPFFKTSVIALPLVSGQSKALGTPWK